MSKIFFGFGRTAGELLHFNISLKEIDIVVANTACKDWKQLFEGYKYMGSKESMFRIAHQLFSKMVQYRLAPSFEDYEHCPEGPVMNITTFFPSNASSFEEAFEKALKEASVQAKFIYCRYAPEVMERSEKYWRTIFSECGLL